MFHSGGDAKSVLLKRAASRYCLTMGKRDSSLSVWLIVAAIGSTVLTSCQSTRHESVQSSGAVTSRAEFSPPLLPENSARGSCRVPGIHGGKAYYSTDGGTWMALATGQVIGEGTKIRTDSHAVYCDLLLKQNGPVLRIRKATTIVLERLRHGEPPGEAYIETHIGLEAGSMLGDVRNLAEKSSYEIKTPRSVYRIRPGVQTRFDLSAKDHLLMMIGVEVEFGWAGKPMLVNSEETFDPKRGIVRSSPAREIPLLSRHPIHFTLGDDASFNSLFWPS